MRNEVSFTLLLSIFMKGIEFLIAKYTNYFVIRMICFSSILCWKRYFERLDIILNFLNFIGHQNNSYFFAFNIIRRHFGKQNTYFFVVADFDRDTVRCRFAFGVNECADVCGNYAAFLTYNWVIDFFFAKIPNITTLYFWNFSLQSKKKADLVPILNKTLLPSDILLIYNQ